MTKTALITGITGQDGAYLAELLLDKGYEVHGVKRRASLINTDRVDHLYQDPHMPDARFFMHYGDLTDATNLIRIVQETKPDEIYNLAAQSHVQVSFETPEYTANADALGTLRLLEAIRILEMGERVRFYQASTSEMFGLVQETPQRETTPFYPRSPYGAAKVYGYWITVNYREAYGMHASNGILFNHESPLRGETFVTRKVTRAVSRMALGLTDGLWLGNLDSLRDWGHARDYVQAMYLMLQQSEPDDYVIATGEQHSVREMCTLAFAEVGATISWQGSGADEVAVVEAVDSDRLRAALEAAGEDGSAVAGGSQAQAGLAGSAGLAALSGSGGSRGAAGSSSASDTAGPGNGAGLAPGDIVVRVDPRYYRPTEVSTLLGDSTKAREQLGWRPQVSFVDLVAEMVHDDLVEARREGLVTRAGFSVVQGRE